MAANKSWRFSTAVEDLPNLVTYQPSGWSDKIVVSTTTGTNTDTMPLTETDILYMDWAVLNDSTIPILTQHFYTLYVDGVEKEIWNSPELNPGHYTNVIDFSIGKLSAGTHEIKIVADSTDVISEKNESDNSYIKTITVERRGTDLATFAADFGRTNCDTGEACEGDFDIDNDVDGSDLAVLAVTFVTSN